MSRTSHAHRAHRVLYTGTLALGTLLLTASIQAASDAGALASNSKAAAASDATRQMPSRRPQATIRIAANSTPIRANGERVAAAVMAQWAQKNPQAAKDWFAEENDKHEVPPPDDNRTLIGTGQASTYGLITTRDVENWDRLTFEAAAQGSVIFHSAEQLGSTIGVSCDMCHPRASNTHPETYPKFQVQLGKVALLRDMINWCIEHPVRGKRLDADDPKMRALEAYILAQRKGVPLDYGKH
jgi:thiosulfate dehydrogenase